jgi:hypothetical protein
VPDAVIEAFANSLKITTEELSENRLFRRIIEDHLRGFKIDENEVRVNGANWTVRQNEISTNAKRIPIIRVPNLALATLYYDEVIQLYPRRPVDIADKTYEILVGDDKEIYVILGIIMNDDVFRHLKAEFERPKEVTYKFKTLLNYKNRPELVYRGPPDYYKVRDFLFDNGYGAAEYELYFNGKLFTIESELPPTDSIFEIRKIPLKGDVKYNLIYMFHLYIYEGPPLYDEVIRFLEEKGFDHKNIFLTYRKGEPLHRNSIMPPSESDIFIIVIRRPYHAPPPVKSVRPTKPISPPKPLPPGCTERYQIVIASILQGRNLVSMLKDFNINNNSSPAEIKSAYKKALLETHTDKNPCPESKAAFIKLRDAYKSRFG